MDSVLKPFRLVLASSSPSREALLRRLGVDFTAISPDIDESPRVGETAEALVLRLSEAKARRVAEAHPDALIIGADQVAVLGTQVVGKPGTHDAAVQQLRAASSQTVPFLSAVCVLNAASGRVQRELATTSVSFRTLDRATIEAYLEREQPYDCAGSFKSEGLGTALLEKLESDDPTALIGLPLIRLVRMLEKEGMDIIRRPRAS